MELEVLPVVLALAGFILLYGAVQNKNPLEVVKLALQGKDPSTASPIFTPGPGLFTETVPGSGSGDPREFHTDGTPRLFPNGTPRYLGDPRPQELPEGDPRKRFTPVPAPGAPGDPRPPVDARRPGAV